MSNATKLPVEATKLLLHCCFYMQLCSVRLVLSHKYSEYCHVTQDAQWKHGWRWQVKTYTIIISCCNCQYCKTATKASTSCASMLGKAICDQPRFGGYEALLKDRMTDSKAYHNFCRMSPADYQELLNLVTPLVSYLDTLLRKAISADERLAVTLRYLATGMSTQYRMPPLDWYLQGHVVTTITRFLQNSTGFQCTRLVVLVWKCLNGTAPGYLSELCVPVASAHFQETTESLSVPHLMYWRLSLIHIWRCRRRG